MLEYSWACACCGQQHHELPLHWSFLAPLQYDMLSDAERESGAELAPSCCRIGEDGYFIRGTIDIPLPDHSEPFSWGVWVSLSEASMQIVGDNWENPGREELGPFYGWLCNDLPYEPSTFGLKAQINLRAPPSIPAIVLEPTDHPLAIEQRQGMTMDRAVAIAEIMLGHRTAPA